MATTRDYPLAFPDGRQVYGPILRPAPSYIMNSPGAGKGYGAGHGWAAPAKMRAALLPGNARAGAGRHAGEGHLLARDRGEGRAAPASEIELPVFGCTKVLLAGR